MTSTVFGILEATLAAGTRELALVAAQDLIADPPDRFGGSTGSLTDRAGEHAVQARLPGGLFP